MDFKLNLKDQIKISDNIKVIFEKNKKYYKKRPSVLLINIFIIIGGFFLNPFIGGIISFIAFFVLPNYKEKIE